MGAACCVWGMVVCYVCYVEESNGFFQAMKLHHQKVYYSLRFLVFFVVDFFRFDFVLVIFVHFWASK